METQNNNMEEYRPATVLAAKQVVDTIFDPHENPRLAKADIIDADHENPDRLIELLISDPAKPILLITTFPIPKAIESKPVLARILKFPNVRIVRSTQFVAESAAIFDIGRYNVNDDAKRASMESLKSTIRHDLAHALNGSKAHNKEELLNKARNQLGFDGDDENVIQKVMGNETEVETDIFTEVNGLFVDWAGTLLNKDYKFNEKLFKQLLKKSESEGLPLVIWTGGEIPSVYELLDLHLEDSECKVNVCNKADCRGLKVKAAVDDLELDELRKTYGFDVEQFYNVNEFE